MPSFKDKIAAIPPIVIESVIERSKQEIQSNKRLMADLKVLSEQKPIDFDFSSIDLSAFDETDEDTINRVAELGIFTSPRETVLQMFKANSFEGLFTFRTFPRKGKDFINSMRQVLSRVRKDAEKQKLELKNFKMYEISITPEAEFDLVTLECSTKKKTEDAIYSEMARMFAGVKIISEE